MWQKVNELAKNYVIAEEKTDQERLFNEIYRLIKPYLDSCAYNANLHSRKMGLFIPEEDFESYMVEYFWKALEGFRKDSEYPFHSIMIHRIRLAEIDVSRKYRKLGNKSDKNGYTYESARWDSLNRKIKSGDSKVELGNFIADGSFSVEDTVISKYEQESLLKEFEESNRTNKRYANIIKYIWLGYYGDDLAIATGEASSYDNKMRKKTSRAKKRFQSFVKESSK